MADGSTNGANGDEFKTFSGTGFGTMMVRFSAGPKDTPKVASSRAYLRGGLPAVYQEGDFGMRFIGALEGLLDPIIAVLDALPSHFNPDHAPRDLLALLASWLGVELNEGQELQHQRDMVRRAADLGRTRGTVRGLELALVLSFPDVPLRVEDQGGVRWSLDQRPMDAPPPSFVVYCDKPVADGIQASIARCIEQYKPVGTAYRLRVKAPKKKDAT
jgi:phage tail-like protein